MTFMISFVCPSCGQTISHNMDEPDALFTTINCTCGSLYYLVPTGTASKGSLVGYRIVPRSASAIRVSRDYDLVEEM